MQLSDPEQMRACKRLIAAVIAQAVADSQLRPISTTKEPQKEALTAIQFLFDHSTRFLEFLDLEPQVFRRNLITQMYDPKNKHFEKAAKHHFCQNYTWWYKKQIA